MPTDPGPQGTGSATLLGLATSCAARDVAAAAREVAERAAGGRGGYVCLCNVHLITLALHDAAVRRALDGAWLRLADGAPIAWLQRRAGRSAARRVGGPDLMPKVVDLGRSLGLRHFLLGSTPEVLAGVQGELRRRFPGAEIVGAYSPPFASRAVVDEESLNAIRSADPHLVWCALGAPKQELWMERASRLLPDRLLVGVGAAFDFMAGSKRRAPRWMQDRGLEWLHRLLAEPERLAGRYVRANSEFLLRCALELARRREGG